MAQGGKRAGEYREDDMRAAWNVEVFDAVVVRFGAVWK